MAYYLLGIKEYNLHPETIRTETIIAIFEHFELAEAFAESCIDYEHGCYYSYSPLSKFESFEIRDIEINPRPIEW